MRLHTFRSSQPIRSGSLEQNLELLGLGSPGDDPRRLVDVANGTIKRLVRDRGFGFIRDDGGQEWFFHRSSVKTEPLSSSMKDSGSPLTRSPRRRDPGQVHPIRSQQLRNRRLRLVKNRWALAEPRAWFCCARDRLGLYGEIEGGSPGPRPGAGCGVSAFDQA